MNRGPRTYGVEGHEPIVDNGNLDTTKKVQKIFAPVAREYFFLNLGHIPYLMAILYLKNDKMK